MLAGPWRVEVKGQVLLPTFPVLGRTYGVLHFFSMGPAATERHSPSKHYFLPFPSNSGWEQLSAVTTFWAALISANWPHWYTPYVCNQFCEFSSLCPISWECYCLPGWLLTTNSHSNLWQSSLIHLLMWMILSTRFLLNSNKVSRPKNKYLLNESYDFLEKCLGTRGHYSAIIPYFIQ